jgi:zinc transporter, ZIP family
MTDWFLDLTPPAQALLAGTFTWLVTAAGASLVFFAKSVSRTFLNVMLGFAAGVMIAASVWSLLLPAIDLSEGSSLPAWFPAAVGFLLGGAFLRLSDYFVPHLHLGLPREDAEGVETNWRRSTLLIMAITLHNIPEGLAIGVAFGAAAQAGGDSVATVGAAVALAIGIGLQNFPEGIAVAMPLRGDGMSRFRSFFYGQLSAIVEPAAAVLGALAVVVIDPALPYALAFAAGAMIFVVVEELVPESQNHGAKDLATIGTMVGFVVMMILDVALG